MFDCSVAILLLVGFFLGLGNISSFRDKLVQPRLKEMFGVYLSPNKQDTLTLLQDSASNLQYRLVTRDSLGKLSYHADIWRYPVEPSFDVLVEEEYGIIGLYHTFATGNFHYREYWVTKSILGNPIMYDFDPDMFEVFRKQ